MIKNIITIVGLLLLIAFGYFLVVLEDQGLQTNNQQVITAAQQETQEFLRRLNDIKTISLRTEVMRDPRFTNRVNYDTPIPVVPVGRENPFITPAN